MEPRGRRSRRFGIPALVLLSLVAEGHAQESPGYVADRTTVAAVAGRAASTGYVLELTAGEIHPAGSGSYCNLGFTDSTGFWSVLGDTEVPVVLQVGQDPLDPDNALLEWSGSAASFDLLRSSLATEARDPLHLLTTTAGCDAADPDPPAPSIFYYVVVPSGSLEAAP
ncbi:MAG: hypothetical protein PVF68_09785 [Acidobacteriota bacterium]